MRVGEAIARIMKAQSNISYSTIYNKKQVQFTRLDTMIVTDSFVMTAPTSSLTSKLIEYTLKSPYCGQCAWTALRDCFSHQTWFERGVPMRDRFTSTAALAMGVTVVLLAPSLAAGQALFAPAANTWTAPRTPDGQPDLQGLWTNATITPFELPAELAGKQFFTEQEVADYEKRILKENNRDRRGANAEADVAGAYNDFWLDRGTKVVPTRRTSLVVDPPDGKVPSLTPDAQKVAAARAEISRRPPAGKTLD
jgi:hypothetical protein